MGSLMHQASSGLGGNREANPSVFFYFDIAITNIYEECRIPIDTLSHCTVHEIMLSSTDWPSCSEAPTSHTYASQPSSVIVLSTSLAVCDVFSPKIIKKRVRKPAGGPLLIRSLISVVNPIERSELSDCTRDSAMYVEIHFITALMRRGVRK